MNIRLSKRRILKNRLIICFLPIIGDILVVDVDCLPPGVVCISVCAVGVIGDKCVTSRICRVIDIIVDDEAQSQARVRDDDGNFEVFAVVVKTIGEDVSFEVCVVKVVTVVEGVIPEVMEVSEVRQCGEVIRADRAGASVVVTRGTIMYEGNT